jgi:hypothetical protein
MRETRDRHLDATLINPYISACTLASSGLEPDREI